MKAVDLILIFEKKSNNQLIKLSESIENNNSILGKENIPHLSLVKGIIKEEDIKKLKLDLEKLNFPKELEISSIKNELEDNKTTSLIISNNKQLEELQQKTKEIFFKYNQKEIKKEYFAQEVNQLTLEWTKNNARSAFNPHISLGFGKIKEKLPQTIKIKDIKIGHLGNYCSVKLII